MERILVIKLSAMGDFLLALGAMAAIRAHHKEAHITLLTTRLFVDMAQRSGYFDEIVVDTRPPAYDLRAWFKLWRFFNRSGFSRVYDLQMNGRTSRYYRLFGKKPAWSGVVKGSPLFYANPEWRDMHAFYRHREVLKVAGIDVALPDIGWMQSDVSLFGLRKPYVLLVPGSAPTRPDKRWPALRYGALGLKLMQRGYDVAVLGTASERDAIDRVVKSCPGIHDLSGQTSFYDIATLARGAAGAVGNDTGPLHLITLSGCPAVALFSASSNPAHSAPVGDVTVIQSDSLDDVSVDDVMQVFKPRETP